jgi:superfamily II DNA or RNA helicase
LENPLDRELLSWMIGNHAEDQYPSYYGYGYMSQSQFCRCELAPATYLKLLPRLCESDRFGWSPERDSPDAEELAPLVWDDGPPWRFKLQFDRASQEKNWRLTGHLRRGDETAALDSVRFADAGLVLFDRVAARLDEGAGMRWIEAMAKKGVLEVPDKQRDAFVQQLCQAPDLPPIEWPEELGWKEIAGTPTPRLTIVPSRYGDRSPLEGAVSFDYGGPTVAWADRQAVLSDPERRELVRRDLAREQAAWAPLQDLHLPAAAKYDRDRYDVTIARKQLPHVVASLIEAGWQVEAEGCKLRRPGQFKINISSGVDWFELEAQADYDGVQVALPELLKALQRGESFVELGDGSRGMLPEEWLARYAPLAEMGQVEDGKLRFVHSQAMLLDAWLAAQDDVDVDATFERVRDRLRSFEGVKPVREPASFQGELRPYQREGLGWLDFLDEFAFGGCLADDMGLGKTIQVLALLESRRGPKKQPRAPSLVVAPRSLIHNWIEEARRFTPQLRVLDYTGQQRSEQCGNFEKCDLVMTTYGTLRRDIGRLKDFEFDYCVLDEAQSIKNADSHSAKACRLLRARRRLAMTGTPVENHLGELWSLFEFLNPGMLGRSAALKRLSASAPGKDPAAIEALAKGLRPFLLRRTKEQVLSELPEKTEQTLYCQLEKKQRKLYDDLRNHYRDLLTKRIDSVGLKKSKIQVLEALLRLRQAACHPGLIDPKQSGQPSAKLEALLEQLKEVLAEGHKALVFSQFTSLLAIVRKELDRRAIAYEYLDGKTRNRKEKVDRFQEDPACPLFLISLKAGGLGLNLTAADYVFILDPWWNPAVEAQAVDRAHRIGQTRRVFAYRLIARDTVEEKILELQRHKQKLAEAIISADNSLIRSLTADDLRWLLS